MTSFKKRVRAAYSILKDDVEFIESDRLYSASSPTTSSSAYRDTTAQVLAPIVARIAIDAASIPIRHIITDETGAFLKTKNSELNKRFGWSANLDQSGSAFIQEAVTTLLHKEACAIIPVHTRSDTDKPGSLDILSLRVGVINTWYNKAVEVDVYNEDTGQRVNVILEKDKVAIPINPLHLILNEPNSTLKRLITKLALLDTVDNRAGSPSLDVILQLPYAVRSARRDKEAATRRSAIEEQLYNSPYGVAYIGANERVTQLNRPIKNTLPDQIRYLTERLYAQLGLTPSVFDGSASDSELEAYYNRTVLPVLHSVVDAMRITFLTKTAVTQGQDIRAFPDLFRFATLETVAEAADKFTRNAIMSSNDIRSKIGLPPSDDPDAKKLRNKNLNIADNGETQDPKKEPEPTKTKE